MTRRQFTAGVVMTSATARADQKSQERLRFAISMLESRASALNDAKQIELGAILIHLAGIAEFGSFGDLQEVLRETMKVNLKNVKGVRG